MSTTRRGFIQQTMIGMSACTSLATAPALAAGASRPEDLQPDMSNQSVNKELASMSITEKNKYLLRARYRQAQLQSIPPTLPGAVEPPAVHKADGNTVISAQDPPGGVDNPAAVIAAIAGWHAQSTAPVFTSYGPMIAEGDAVVEEWETFFHGLDGTMYSNQYCWVKRFDGEREVEVREYVDSHHAYIVLGLHAPWKELAPATAPRRHWRPAQSFADAPPLTAMETVFPVRSEFELAPSMLSDIQPSGSFNARPSSGAADNKKIVGAMRQAQAEGNMRKMSSYYADGFKHFIAGEGPLGWNHLPLEQLYAPLVQHLAGPIQVRLGQMIAEGDSVFEEMDILAPLDDGTVYNNWHCFIHELKDGCIVQTREYMDTHHFWVMLSRWADWGKTVVPPMRQARRSNLPFVTETFQGKNPFLQLERWQAL